jgi:hypothetical protein
MTGIKMRKKKVDRDPLTDAYLAECEQRARRFSGAYTGTSGTLAAMVLTLLAEVRRLRVEAARREELRRPLPALGYFAE